MNFNTSTVFLFSSSNFYNLVQDDSKSILLRLIIFNRERLHRD
jgi:hypothetical protein